VETIGVGGIKAVLGGEADGGGGAVGLCGDGDGAAHVDAVGDVELDDSVEAILPEFLR